MKNIINIAYTFVGNMIGAFIKWLLLILIVRFTNPEMVGYYTFAIALTSPIMLFANMRLRLRYVVEDDLYFKDLKKLRLILDVLCTVIIILITVIFLRDYLLITLLISISKVLDLRSDLLYGILQKSEDFKVISLMMIGKNSLIITLFGISIVLTENLYISIVCQIIAQVVWLLLIENRAQKRINKSKYIKSDKKIIFSIFIAGLPLGIVQLLNSYNILIPRYVIERYLSLEAVGIFASISYLLTIIGIFMNALSQNFIVSVKRDVANNNFEKVKKFVNQNSLLAALLLGGVSILSTYFFGEFFINLVYGEAYARHSFILAIISISIIFNFLTWMYDTALMALKIYNFQLVVSITTLITSTIVSFVSIINFGLLGAAWAIVIITFIQALIRYIIVNYKLSRMEND
ncbi:O-antigen/teichoic acid export membrane protein [Staphylococcus hominis]|uniref:lipopolysaccharide biosynthesis protein n=1 Tax=Staphylococcus hominis TaxID=1290 RepID=UPI001614C548|nr:oligosaccharide flippase family protein [Staphylococcus hominis]MBB4832127.1 O-antigen/teichoic acid export membrane protein [Staphylococcus hominis]